MSQQKIDEAPQAAPNPKDYRCDWCGETAAYLFELKKGRRKSGTQMYVPACGRHKETAEMALGHPPTI
jgi:hypothetical protein